MATVREFTVTPFIFKMQPFLCCNLKLDLYHQLGIVTGNSLKTQQENIVCIQFKKLVLLHDRK